MTEVKTLNRRIAEALGWTDIEPYHFWQESNDGAYERDWFRGTTPDGSADTMLSDYEHDLNVVFAAFPPGVALEVWVDQNGYGNAMLHTSESGTEAFTHGATCQEAAAKALLTWKQSIGGE